MDAGSHRIYFILGYRCSFKKRRSTLTHFIAGIGILPFGWGGGSGSVKLTSHHQKETWLHCVHFVLWCSKHHHSVSLQLWYTNYVTVCELTIFRVTCIQCNVFKIICFLYCLDLLLISVEHTDITVANIGRAVLQWEYSTKLSVAAITKWQCYNLKKSSILLNNVKVWHQP